MITSYIEGYKGNIMVGAQFYNALYRINTNCYDLYVTFGSIKHDIAGYEKPNLCDADQAGNTYWFSDNGLYCEGLLGKLRVSVEMISDVVPLIVRLNILLLGVLKFGELL